MLNFINNFFVLLGLALLIIGSIMMSETTYLNLSRGLAIMGVGSILFGIIQQIRKGSEKYKEYKEKRKGLEKE